jgi:hypothetical protein
VFKNMKIIIVAIAITIALVIPVYAQQQACPPWMWGCYQQPQYQDPYTPQHTRKPITHHRKHYTERESVHKDDPKPVRHSHNDEPKPKPRIHAVMVARQGKTWKDMDQDQGREWILEQAKSFCEHYPSDKACKPKE